jgi:hypothetical protein
LPSAVTNSSPSTSTGKSAGLRGLSLGMSPSTLKEKAARALRRAAFRATASQAGSVAGMATSIQRKGSTRCKIFYRVTIA